MNENDLDKYFSEESCQSFDFSKPPLVRLRLLSLTPKKYILIITSHHVLSDGWSMGLLSKYLFANYFALLKGVTPTPYNGLQYSDYIAWYLNYLKSDQYRADKEYWLSKINSASVETLDKLVNIIRPAKQNYLCNRYSMKYDRKMLSQLKSFSKENNSTLFNVMLTAYLIALYRCRTIPTVSIGIPVATRPFPGTEAILGYCTNIVPMKFLLNSNDKFSINNFS